MQNQLKLLIPESIIFRTPKFRSPKIIFLLSLIEACSELQLNQITIPGGQESLQQCNSHRNFDTHGNLWILPSFVPQNFGPYKFSPEINLC